jgi:hypothetical protein
MLFTILLFIYFFLLFFYGGNNRVPWISPSSFSSLCFYLKLEVKFKFSIECVTTKSSSRDQPSLYKFISYWTNLILLFECEEGESLIDFKGLQNSHHTYIILSLYFIISWYIIFSTKFWALQHWCDGGGTTKHGNSVGQIPADFEVLPWQSCATPILYSRRLGPLPSTNGGGTAQAITTMGRVVRRGRGHTAGILSAYSDGRHQGGELMEYRAPQKVLPLVIPQKSRGQVVLCNQKVSSSIKLSSSKGIQALDWQLT